MAKKIVRMAERINRGKSGVDQIEVMRLRAEEFFQANDTFEKCLAAFRKPDATKRIKVIALAGAVLTALRGREYVLGLLKRKYDVAGTIDISLDLYDVEEQVMSRGYWCEVFKLNPKHRLLPTLVYKVEFPASHSPEEDLQKILAMHQEDHRALTEAYSEIPGFIPDTHYLTSTSPRTGKPAIAMFQEYAGDESFDLFDPARKHDVEQLLLDPSFKAVFDEFKRVTLELHKDLRAPDLAGTRNVLVVKNREGVYTLRLVDQHLLHPDNAVAQKAQVESMRYLQKLSPHQID